MNQKHFTMTVQAKYLKNMLEFKLLGFAIFCRHISLFLGPKFFPKGLRSGYFDIPVMPSILHAAAKYGRYMPVRHFIDGNIAKKPDLRYNKFFGKVA